MTAPTTPKYALVRTIEERADQVAPFLPKGRSLDSVAHAVQLLALKNPDLLAAIPSSLIVAVTRGLRAGLEIGEEWHLLTFKNKELSQKHNRDVFDVVGTADYKALAQMMIASGAVRYVDPQCVYKNDQFSYELGLNKDLRHLPGPAGKRGELVGAYVILRLPFGASDFLYMPIEEIDAIRTTKSKSWRNGPCPPWYAEKTVIKRIAKLMPKDRRLAAVMRAIEQDDASEFDDVPEAEAHQERPALPAAVQDDEDELLEGAEGELPLGDSAKPRHRSALREG